MKIRIEWWSHCCGEWQFYGYFDNEEAADKHISGKGFDPIYFRLGL
jgi:hypothetical protein